MQQVNRVNKFFLGISVLCIFLLFGISTFIWQTIPFFTYIQFPARWFNIIAFAVIFLSAPVFWFFSTLHTQNKIIMFLILFLISICLLDYRYIKNAFSFNSKDILSSQHFGYASREHLPVGVDVDKIQIDEFKQRVVIEPSIGDHKILQWTSHKRIIHINADDSVVARIRTFVFPGWKAYLDGVEVNISSAKGTGEMFICIPEGSHTLELTFVDTPIRRYSKLISLLSAFGMIFAVFIFRERSAIMKSQSLRKE